MTLSRVIRKALNAENRGLSPFPVRFPFPFPPFPDKAKGILIQRKGLSKEQAYALLRRTAINRGLRIAGVARTLSSLEGMDG